MKPEFLINHDLKYVTVIEHEHLVPMYHEIAKWCKQYPDRYKVYSAGFIMYNNESDLSFLLLRWS